MQTAQPYLVGKNRNRNRCVGEYIFSFGERILPEYRTRDVPGSVI